VGNPLKDLIEPRAKTTEYRRIPTNPRLRSVFRVLRSVLPGVFRPPVSWAGLLTLALVIENAYLAVPVVAHRWVLRLEESDAARGRRLAETFGCLNCHGPDGRGEVPNPGSRYESVPAFSGQTLMMFVKNDRELREYILDGAPARRLRDRGYRAQLARQALRMPEFRGWVSDSDVAALVAYLRLVSGMLHPPAGELSRGEQLVHTFGCFSCHGEMGMGGHPNPGSLKGYIPGFLGDDFHELVRNDGELLTWIRDGKLPRIAQNPIGRYFFARQRVRMPAFKSFTGDDDLRAIAAYVRWLADGGWRGEPLSPSSGKGSAATATAVSSHHG